MGFVSFLLEQWNNLLPSPPSQPGTWHEHKRSHIKIELRLHFTNIILAPEPSIVPKFSNPCNLHQGYRFDDNILFKGKLKAPGVGFSPALHDYVVIRYGEI